MIGAHQSGKVIRFTAKPGKGEELFALCAEMSERSAATDKTIIARSEVDPDTLWAMEWFLSDDKFAEQDADPTWDEIHARIGALVADFDLVKFRAYFSNV